jgi:hypothetical protein
MHTPATRTRITLLRDTGPLYRVPSGGAQPAGVPWRR